MLQLDFAVSAHRLIFSSITDEIGLYSFKRQYENINQT
jgi:hypothetical protein